MLLQRVVELITPPDCLGCGAEGGLVCDLCVLELDNSRLICVRCRRQTPGAAICEVCLDGFVIEGVTVAAYYDGVARELIHRLKFKHERSAARIAAKLILNQLERADYDVITAVPISPARYRERGFSQAELIAKHVAKELKLPYASLLGRNNGDHQIGKGRNERFDQIEGAYYMAKRPRVGARILIIDDVVTTGATLDECAKVLREGGAQAVYGAAVAKH